MHYIYAGASSIVSSLWVVGDETAERLMVNFYQALISLVIVLHCARHKGISNHIAGNTLFTGQPFS